MRCGTVLGAGTVSISDDDRNTGLCARMDRRCAHDPGSGAVPVEIAVSLVGLVLALLGLLIAWFSRTDRLLTQIRDVLIEIRDKWT
jgi:hypothetical protein